MTATLYATLTQYLRPQTEVCEPKQCVKGDPKGTVPVPYHEPLENTTHAVLQVQRPDSPVPKHFRVNVFNAYKGERIPVTVRSTDTIGKLKQRLLKLKPDLGENLNLALNGKPVLQQQTLCELQVKPEAAFITYQKCHGG